MEEILGELKKRYAEKSKQLDEVIDTWQVGHDTEYVHWLQGYLNGLEYMMTWIELEGSCDR